MLYGGFLEQTENEEFPSQSISGRNGDLDQFGVRIRESRAMLDYPCSTCTQPRRLPPLLLVSIAILIATIAEAREHCGPQIITYGEPCPMGHPQNLPYRIQTPLTVPKSSEAAYVGPPGGKTYCYGIDEPRTQWRSSNVGFQLPVSVQQPLIPYRYSEDQERSDPLRGRTYGIGIQNEPSAPQHTPSLGLFDFNVQHSVPGPRYYQASSDPSSRLRVQIQPIEGSVHYSRPLWGPLSVDIERPAYEPRNEEGSPGAPRRLTGLSSRIDRLLIPACDLPMGDRNRNCGSHPSTCGCAH